MSGDRVLSSAGKSLEIDCVLELIVKCPKLMFRINLFFFKSLTISNVKAKILSGKTVGKLMNTSCRVDDS